MKSKLLALLGAVSLLISESRNEINERCSGTTHQKFLALQTDVQEAMKEGVTEEGAGGVAVVDPNMAADAIKRAFSEMAEALESRLSAAVDKSVRTVHAEFMAAQAPTA